MPRPPNLKCVQCAKLVRDEAQRLHGESGDGSCCWDDKRCDDRRYSYRVAPMRNEVRRQRRRQQKGRSTPLTQTLYSSARQLQGDCQTDKAARTTPRRSRSQRLQTVTVTVLDVATPHAYLYWYRRAKDAPVHAIGAELWIGDHRRARACFHVTGGGAVQIKAMLLHVLEEFSAIAGAKVPHFRDEVELMPDQCPLRPCPLHLES